MSQSMEADAVAVAFAYLEMEDKKEIAKVFGKSLRTVQDWFQFGAPPHIAMAIRELRDGKLKRRGVKFFLRRVGRARDDGRRYRR